MTQRRPLVVPALLAAVLTLCGAVAGCDASAEAGEGTDGAPSVIAPGKPGEPAKTLSPEEAEAQAADGGPNAADRRYVADMITHHGQALTMTDLAADHATKDSSVARLAGRIADAQGPEIKAMRGWEKTHPDSGGPDGHTGHHDHADMPGMATKAQLAKLGEARGAAFDELFVDLMTAHHQGAVQMATTALAEGNDVQVEEMATDVIASQTAEIGRMREMG